MWSRLPSPTNGRTLHKVQRRWYVDADTLGLGHILAAARVDVTYCGDSGERKKRARRLPPCEIQDTETPDEEWIPKVERAGMAIITRDRHIETRTKEKRIVLECGARMFAIVTERKLHNWDMLEIVVHQWPAMEKAAEEPGPYIYAITRTTMHKIDLTSS